MLILLPPSEGKATPRRGATLDPGSLSFPELVEARGSIMDALVGYCGSAAIDEACKTLGVTAGQAAYVELNAGLKAAPTTRADRLYTGVLYDALDLPSLSGPARSRATRWVAVTSSLFGLVRPSDRLPAYRLAGNVSLPGFGSVAGHWRSHLGASIGSHSGLILDLRSSTYGSFWKPTGSVAARTATVRVLHEVNGKRSVVSHFNKATKGRIVRDLLLDGSSPRTPSALADHLRSLGWTVEMPSPTSIDVVVTAL